MRPCGKNGRDPPRLWCEQAMAGGIDATVKAMKAAGAYAVPDDLAGQPCGEQLPPRHDPMLAFCQTSDCQIWTLVAFYVYRTFNLIGVGNG
jgi:hypothetical protein